MTPGEWAADVVDGFLGYAGHTNADAVLREQVEAAVRAAVIEEREACAKVADKLAKLGARWLAKGNTNWDITDMAKNIAADIRKRE
jgi:hypothetical protein